MSQSIVSWALPAAAYPCKLQVSKYLRSCCRGHAAQTPRTESGKDSRRQGGVCAEDKSGGAPRMQVRSPCCGDIDEMASRPTVNSLPRSGGSQPIKHKWHSHRMVTTGEHTLLVLITNPLTGVEGQEALASQPAISGVGPGPSGAGASSGPSLTCVMPPQNTAGTWGPGSGSAWPLPPETSQ